MATSGENYWPPTGRTSWPLTVGFGALIFEILHSSRVEGPAPVSTSPPFRRASLATAARFWWLQRLRFAPWGCNRSVSNVMWIIREGTARESFEYVPGSPPEPCGRPLRRVEGVSPAHRIEGRIVVVGEGSRLRPDQRLQVVLMALEEFVG